MDSKPKKKLVRVEKIDGLDVFMHEDVARARGLLKDYDDVMEFCTTEPEEQIEHKAPKNGVSRMKLEEEER